MSSTIEVEYLKEMGSLNYPFIASTVPQQLKELFSDLVITIDRSDLPDDLTDYTGISLDDWEELSVDDWVSAGMSGESYAIFVDSVTITGSSVDFVVKYTSSTATGTLFDTSSATVTHTDWGSNPTWRVYEWSSGSMRVKTVVNTSKFVIYSGTSLNLGVSSRCFEVRPTRVNTLRVYDENNVAHDFNVADVVFKPGYNMELTVNPSDISPLSFTTTTDVESKHVVGFDCIPGKGLGKYQPDCTDDLVVRVINSQTADEHGNFRLDPRDCYWAESLLSFGGTPPGNNPRQGTPTPGILNFHNNCKACVTCDDFYREYVKLSQIRDRAGLLYNRLKAALKLYDYYRSLAEEIKIILNNTSSTFSVNKENANLFTFKFTLSAGKNDIDMFDASLLPPAGFNLIPKKGSGWSKIGGKTKPRPMDITTSPAIDGHISYPLLSQPVVYFPKETVSYWQWSGYLKPVSQSANTITTQSVSFSALMTAHISGQPAGTIVNLGTDVHTTSVTY